MYDCLFNNFGIFSDLVFSRLQAGCHDECYEKVVLTCVSYAVRCIRRYVYDLICLYWHWSFLIFDEDGSLSFNYIVDLFRFRVQMWVQPFTGLEYTEGYKLILCSVFIIGGHELNRASKNNFGRYFFEFEDSYRHVCMLVLPCLIAI